ncbi:hypothetical protein PIROE2DRAFT_9700 [Piromyces sp. E2]|nr:hypothetical protein PIROE2DRAFT_9700 [Piromyces sp. E2]|eukprot:OUM63691.1 hypothetical protein PIROE2DRAFT_9700 [Piromyces sp. E2]
MGCGSCFVDASLQPMLAQAYDNLLEKKQIENEKMIIKNSEDTINSLSTDSNDVNIDIKNSETIIDDSSDLHRDIGNTDEKETNIKINKKENNNQNDKNDEENNEDAHNKYTRVFSLGNMALNIGFIAGPMLSSFIVALVKGDEPHINRFNSSFFKCCLIFSIFGCLSSLVAIIPGMKRYQNKKILINNIFQH